MKNKQLIIFIALMLATGIFSGCEKSNDVCGGDNPEKQLSWLKNEIQRLENLNSCNSISRSTYKEQTVFILTNCDPNAISIPLLYNCDGMQLTLSQADYRELKFTGEIELIWKSK